jgi:hypothetical protein
MALLKNDETDIKRKTAVSLASLRLPDDVLLYVTLRDLQALDVFKPLSACRHTS